jgi:hypothetical protein
MPRRSTLLVAVSTVLLLDPSSNLSAQSCPSTPPPDCGIDDQIASGRWHTDQVNGSYTFSGSERYCEFEDDCTAPGDYQPISGTLSVSKLGGPDQNFLDIECDGTVTGQGRERISGTITKSEAVVDPVLCLDAPYDMSWNVTIERTYDITGNVTGNGQLDLDYNVHTATIDIDGNFAWGQDCFWLSYDDSVTGFDISGDTEQVRLSGSYDPDSATWNPTRTVTGARSWVDDIAHRLKLDSELIYGSQPPPQHVLNPSLQPPGSSQGGDLLYNEYFVQDTVTVSDSVSYTPEPQTPVVTSAELQEPQVYLRDVPVMTDLLVEIDWRNQSPGQVEFTYGGTTETVAGADQVTWSFDAGDAADTIRIVARRGSEESQAFDVSVPKLDVPGWAESPASWTGGSGVRYDGTLNWPISLNTTRTLDTISLFTGLWGISGGASSEFNATAFSNGSPGSGNLTASADFQFAGKSFALSMEGDNQTTLSCNELSTSGSATVEVPGPKWKETIGPFTLVPGIQSGACALSGFLCSVLGSVGIKAEAQATLSGTPTYSSQPSEIRWDGGSVGGSLSGQISAGISLPPPIASVANASVWGGATGCIEVGVVPDFQLQQLGGQLDAGAQVTFLGSTSQATEEWPFGDSCGRTARTEGRGLPNAWVPADGELAMVAGPGLTGPTGIAVWTEPPPGQSRPSADLFLRTWSENSWGPIRPLTADTEYDAAPAAAFVGLDRALIVFQRSESPIPAPPASAAALEAFGNTVELAWIEVDTQTGTVLNNGLLTTNARMDFGPRLIRARDPDANGELHLFWQEADAGALNGSAVAPAAVRHARWDDTIGAFDTPIAATEALIDNFGWSAAVWNDQTMLLGLTRDTDAALGTGDDREIQRLLRDNGSWEPTPTDITNDADVDDSVLAVFQGDGEPLLVWRSGESAEELAGAVPAAPAFAFTTPDAARDGGVDSTLAHARIVDEGRPILLWRDGTELLETRRIDGVWSEPAPRLGSGRIENIHAADRVDDVLVFGYSLQAAPDSSAPPGDLEPRFLIESLPDEVFIDGFESTR